jgi:translation initiation factor 1 (eIF-1/SUI1)
MPKRGKKKSGDGREEYEGRPAELTFAAFLPTAANEIQTTFTQESHETTTTGAEAQTPDDISPTELPQSSERAQEYTVTRTKKGKLPITYENRSKGKKVTVVSNVGGNAEVLLAELRKRLGVGGVSRGTFIELQGDQQKFVEQFLNKHPCVK